MEIWTREDAPQTTKTDSPDEVRQQWQVYARSIVRNLMHSSGVTYKELADLLAEIGFCETKQGLTNKINRGAFRADLLIAIHIVLQDVCPDKRKKIWLYKKRQKERLATALKRKSNPRD